MKRLFRSFIRALQKPPYVLFGLIAWLLVWFSEHRSGLWNLLPWGLLAVFFFMLGREVVRDRQRRKALMAMPPDEDS
jgi:uncharacterized BrkB/YihY/UPF0761 family membrane protein